MTLPFQIIEGGSVTSAQGFKAAAVVAGLKTGERKDLALLVSSLPAEAAATFTTNQVKAAPVKVSMQRLKNGKVRGVIINAGNANACTGLEGIQNAKEMVELTAQGLKCDHKQVLVCSTGRIGIQLPMEKVRAAIHNAVAALGEEEGHAAAQAIMTSDTFPKEIAVSTVIDGKKVTVGGMAKGAGMIHPDMATMLGFITTDALVDKATLRLLVREAVDSTFNRISIDGDTSTNDTVITLANGLAGNNILNAQHPQIELFQTALRYVMKKLARMIVEDGEGITKVVEVCVKGAHSQADAKRATLAVVRSMLVKTSWCGEDPNWGRIMDAIGYSKARVREELVEIYYDGILAVAHGMLSKTPFDQLQKVVKKRSFTITIHLHSGTGEYSILTTDLTEKYVELNKGE